MPQGIPSEITFHAGAPEEKQGKWACVFEARRGERVCSRITTCALWDTRESATAATERAMSYLKEHDQWPNFCAPW